MVYFMYAMAGVIFAGFIAACVTRYGDSRAAHSILWLASIWFIAAAYYPHV